MNVDERGRRRRSAPPQPRAARTAAARRRGVPDEHRAGRPLRPARLHRELSQHARRHRSDARRCPRARFSLPAEVTAGFAGCPPRLARCLTKRLPMLHMSAARSPAGPRRGHAVCPASRGATRGETPRVFAAARHADRAPRPGPPSVRTPASPQSGTNGSRCLMSDLDGPSDRRVGPATDAAKIVDC